MGDGGRGAEALRTVAAGRGFPEGAAGGVARRQPLLAVLWPTAKARILVVDDDTDVAEMFAFCLRREGFKVEVAYSGADALQAASCFRPDLVLLNFMMPCLNGLEACRMLRADPKYAQVPVLITTGSALSQEEAVEAGALGVVHLPLGVKDLLRRVRQALREGAAG